SLHRRQLPLHEAPEGTCISQGGQVCAQHSPPPHGSLLPQRGQMVCQLLQESSCRPPVLFSICLQIPSCILPAPLHSQSGEHCREKHGRLPQSGDRLCPPCPSTWRNRRTPSRAPCSCLT